MQSFDLTQSAAEGDSPTKQVLQQQMAHMERLLAESQAAAAVAERRFQEVQQVALRTISTTTLIEEIGKQLGNRWRVLLQC